jgi:PAS domain-containing protein
MSTARIPPKGARPTAEARLRESEARFRALFESSALPLFEQDWSEAKRRLDRLAAAGVADLGR